MVARNNIDHQETNPLNLLTEDMIRLNEVPAELPERVNVSTVWRWATRGVGGIKLETVKIGGKKLTSRQAAHSFHRGDLAQLTLPKACR